MSHRAAESELTELTRAMSAQPHAASAGVSRGPQIPLALALPLVLLAAALGAWLIYRYAIRGTSPAVAEVVVLDEDAQRRSMGSVSRQRGAIYVRGADFQLRATRSGESAYSIFFDFTPEVRRSWVTPEQWDLHQIGLRAGSIPKFARHIQLTDEQRQQIKGLPRGIELTPAEVQKLRPLLGDWDRAQDPVVQRSAQGPLLQAVRELAASHRDTARQAQLRRVQEMAKIITPEQRKLAESYILPTPRATSP